MKNPAAVAVGPKMKMAAPVRRPEKENMTKAATKFLSEIRTSWDSLDPWQATAECGLAEYDRGVLKKYAQETGENFRTAAAEALAAIREHVKQARS